MPPVTPLPSPVLTKPISSERIALLKQKSEELEAAFLSEMLSFAGLGDAEGSFNGGIGEEQFSSFLRAEQAKMMVARGGIGLAEQIFQSLVRHQNG
jgi:flagellar protein FlgJ